MPRHRQRQSTLSTNVPNRDHFIQATLLPRAIPSNCGNEIYVVRGLFMAPFIVLTTLFVVFSVAGHFQLPVSYGWWTSLRLSLSGMFLLTASAHWGKRRPDLIK